MYKYEQSTTLKGREVSSGCECPFIQRSPHDKFENDLRISKIWSRDYLPSHSGHAPQIFHVHFSFHGFDILAHHDGHLPLCVVPEVGVGKTYFRFHGMLEVGSRICNNNNKRTCLMPPNHIRSVDKQVTLHMLNPNVADGLGSSRKKLRYFAL